MATWNSRGLRGSTFEESYQSAQMTRYEQMGPCLDSENTDADYSRTN